MRLESGATGPLMPLLRSQRRIERAALFSPGASSVAYTPCRILYQMRMYL